MRTCSRKLTRPVIFCIGLLSGHLVHANNIQVSNTTLTGNTGTTVLVRFDLSWENSWRGGGLANWDAAWVFVKCRLGNGLWVHTRLNNTGHTAPVGSLVEPGLLTPGTAYNASTNPVIGTFIRRSTDGTGTFTLTGVQLRWDYSQQGFTYNDIAEVRVYAMEVVCVPQGTYVVGSTSSGQIGGETAGFTLTTINTGDATVIPSGSGSLGGQAGGYPTAQTAPTSSSWPNGYNTYYCMKYETSQQAYVDFLNTLLYPQQVSRTATAPNSAAGTGALSSTNANRNGIDIQVPGVYNTSPAIYACNLNGNTVYSEVDDGKDIACNWLHWTDLAAYLDWCGLRPMTEMEYEKACRGSLPSIPSEYAWGGGTATATAYGLLNAGTASETLSVASYSTVSANANHSATSTAVGGPLRVGIFAGHANNTGRMTSGAGYYGIMELTGNTMEWAVTIGNVQGRAFLGSHGDGTVNPAGDHTPADWPTSTAGAGQHGGAFNTLLTKASDRQNNAIIEPSRAAQHGGRGVRTTP